MAYGRWYNKSKYLCMTAGLNLSSDTIRVMLVKPTYNFNPDHNFVSDVVSEEVSGTNYSRQTVAGKTVTEDDTNDLARYTNNTVTFSNVTIGSFNGAIFYKFVTNDSDSPLIAYFNFDTQSASAADVTLVPNASEGLLQIF